MSELLNFQTTVFSTISDDTDFSTPMSVISNEEFKKMSLVSFFLYMSLDKLQSEIMDEMSSAINDDQILSLFMFLTFPIALIFYQILYRKIFVQNLTSGLVKKLENTFLALPPRILINDTYLKNKFSVSKSNFMF